MVDNLVVAEFTALGSSVGNTNFRTVTAQRECIWKKAKIVKIIEFSGHLRLNTESYFL